MNYTLHQLRIFLCVVEHESVTKAAKELFLTQPAVSIQLKKLQDQFEIPLTERIGRKLYITEFGQQIAQTCRNIMTANDEVLATINDYKGLLAGKIHIAVVSTGKYVMPYFLSGFVAKYPQVQVRMDVTNKNQVVAALENNETDFALVSVLPDKLDLEAVELMENHLYLVGNKAETAKLGELPLATQAISELPLIFREQGSATRLAMESFISEHDIPLHQTLALTSNEAVKQAVNAGLGFSVMPLIGLRNGLLNAELKLIPVAGLPVITSWRLVYRKGKAFSPAMRAFLKYLVEHKEALIQEHFSWTDAFVKKKGLDQRKA